MPKKGRQPRGGKQPELPSAATLLRRYARETGDHRLDPDYRPASGPQSGYETGLAE